MKNVQVLKESTLEAVCLQLHLSIHESKTNVKLSWSDSNNSLPVGGEGVTAVPTLYRGPCGAPI